MRPGRPGEWQFDGEPNDIRAARGCLVGVAIGALLWAVLLFVWWWLM